MVSLCSSPCLVSARSAVSLTERLVILVGCLFCLCCTMSGVWDRDGPWHCAVLGEMQQTLGERYKNRGIQKKMHNQKQLLTKSWLQLYVTLNLNCPYAVYI